MSAPFRKMPPILAAPRLAARIFGEHRGYQLFQRQPPPKAKPYRQVGDGTNRPILPPQSPRDHPRRPTDHAVKKLKKAARKPLICNMN